MRSIPASDDWLGTRTSRPRRAPAPLVRRRGRLLAFGWYGGKYSHLDWLLPLLPVQGVHHYCEPFGGSAAVLLNRPPAPVETYNDIDGEVVNFFRVLREKPRELYEALRLTPFSREEFALACATESDDDISDVERARRFFIRARQSRFALAQTASLGRWAHCIHTSRNGMAGSVSRWLNSIEGLVDVIERLRRVQIENRPAIDVLQLYDSPKTLFYLDPPYPHEARGDAKAYAYEMSEDDHRQLARVVRSLRAKVAISGYRCPLMDELYGDWRRHDAPAKMAHTAKRERQECLWTNY